MVWAVYELGTSSPVTFDSQRLHQLRYHHIALRNDKSIILETDNSLADIFVVVDSMTDALVVDSSLLETMSQRRVKVSVLIGGVVLDPSQSEGAGGVLSLIHSPEFVPMLKLLQNDDTMALM